MNAAKIIEQFNALGITLKVREGKIVARPISAVPPDLAETVRQHKEELLKLLGRPKPHEDTNRDEARPADVITATLRAVDTVFLHKGAEDIAPLEFPLCPGCGQRRYWLGTHGKVVCSRCGHVPFEILELKFHTLS